MLHQHNMYHGGTVKPHAHAHGHHHHHKHEHDLNSTHGIETGLTHGAHVHGGQLGHTHLVGVQ